MSSQVTFACPRCGQMDKVQKVTVIVTEGISISQSQISSGVPVRWDRLPAQEEASSVTMLAKRLSFPLKEPVGLGYAAFLLLAFALLWGLGGFFGLYFLYSTLSDQSAWGDTPMIVCFSFLGFGGCISGLFFFVLLISVLSSGGRRRFDANQQQYQRALAKWHELYYCYRDDIVFVPGQSGYASPEQMNAFLTR